MNFIHLKWKIFTMDYLINMYMESLVIESHPSHSVHFEGRHELLISQCLFGNFLTICLIDNNCIFIMHGSNNSFFHFYFRITRYFTVLFPNKYQNFFIYKLIKNPESHIKYWLLVFYIWFFFQKNAPIIRLHYLIVLKYIFFYVTYNK